MSHDSAVSNPPPMAKPFTAAMIGFSRSNRDESPAKPCLASAFVAAHRGGLQIVARAKRLVASPGQYRNPQVRIGGKVVPALSHLNMHIHMHRVVDIGPVHCHKQDVPAFFGCDEFDSSYL